MEWDFAWENLDAQTGPLMQQDTEGIGDGAEDNDQLTTAPHIPDGQSQGGATGEGGIPPKRDPHT